VSHQAGELHGAGHWSQELQIRFGIDPAMFGEFFFARHWAGVVTGRRSIQDPLAQALVDMGSQVRVEQVLECWFEADFVPFDASFDLARRIARNGRRVVLATNQEHRRAHYLAERIGAVVPLTHVLYSADLGHQKHDRRFFAAASEELELAVNERSNVVFVDDKLANVDTARAFGWQAIHASTNGLWRKNVGQLFDLES